MLHFQLRTKGERRDFKHAGGPIEFGRGAARSQTARCVIHDEYVSKDHLRVEELPGGRIRVDNLSQRNPVRLAEAAAIAPGTSRELDLPLRLGIGETLIRIEGDDPSFDQPDTIAPPVRARDLVGEHATLARLGHSPSPERLAHWFETVMAVQRAAAGSPEFYGQTARALVDLVGLDRGLVLLRRGEDWEAAADFPPGRTSETDFSYTVLRHVAEERRTFYRSSISLPSADLLAAKSLRGLDAWVAAPVFDSQEQVIGALYGTRAVGRGHTGIGPLEAQVVQVLASAVGAGLARLEREAEATRLRVQFEQFFPAALVQELQRHPNLLDGQEREVTVLFSDLRGFSRLAEALGPRETCRLLGDVVEHLTEQVRQYDGVVVDYQGDGMLAMWNAPADQPDHAARACRAALAMQTAMARLSSDWANVAGGPLALGVGLNTGLVLVGNTGSRHRFKYGPLGHPVNLASRVQGATKHLGLPILITGFTRAQLGDAFATRKLCRVRVVGIQEAVELHELHAESATPEWCTRRDAYEKGLSLFEAGQWGPACQTLYPLLAGMQGRYDVPSLELIARSVEHLKSPPKAFDPVLTLPSK